MKLYNTLSKTVQDFVPIKDNQVRIYSCGPTVYDHSHIGNLASYVYADTLRRLLKANNYDVHHVMNITDVDDKTIKRSREESPNEEPKMALQKLTDKYSGIFWDDMKAIGNDIDTLTFVKATENIQEMQALITKLHKDGFAYIADDGVYFSIEKYRTSGKKYGQLLEISASNTSEARIQNDEYDKESVHDFALWKKKKSDEPAWEFTLDGHDLTGRPGWHIECSAMSAKELGQPFDIHTGGVDLIFPHHENEIAQSTAGQDNIMFSHFFFHNEHLHVDGKKMSKSLNNFYTLEAIKKKGFDPLAFRLMVLQSHYRSQSNFTWENLKHSQKFLQRLRAFADLRWQPKDKDIQIPSLDKFINAILNYLNDDINSVMAISLLSTWIVDDFNEQGFISIKQVEEFKNIIKKLDNALGLGLLGSQDIIEMQKQLIQDREEARKSGDFDTSDKVRSELVRQKIGLNDTPLGPIWYRL